MSEGISSQKLTPKIHLETQCWEAFKAHVNTNYPCPSFTHEQREFVRKALLQDNGNCSDLNRYWVSFFVQSLLENADESWHLDAKSLNEQIDKLKSICARGILGFYELQHALRIEIPYQDRNAYQERMLEIHPNIVNFPIELCVDLGTILNIQKFQRAGHLKTPGESNTDASLLFQQVHNKLQQMNEAGKGKLERQVTGKSSVTDESTESEWSPHGSDDTYMRLCTYKVWADKYESEEEWSPNKMVNDWLKDAIHLYNHVSSHWPNCKVKHFSDKQFHAIQTTAINSWLADVANRAATTSKVSKPTGNWISDWHSTPVYEKRHEWEQYYCTVILNAKNIAKLLEEKLHPRGEAVPMEEEGQVPEVGPTTKKARTEGEGESSNNNPLQIIVKEFHKLERRIDHLEKHENERHQEILRELTGHFHPIRVHLLHLNQSQHHLQSTVDRLRK